MIMNMEIARCPTCDGELIATSSFDFCEFDPGKMAVTQVGVCDCCGNQYEWTEYFCYCGHGDIKKTEIKAREV